MAKDLGDLASSVSMVFVGLKHASSFKGHRAIIFDSHAV